MKLGTEASQTDGIKITEVLYTHPDVYTNRYHHLYNIVGSSGAMVDYIYASSSSSSPLDTSSTSVCCSHVLIYEKFHGYGYSLNQDLFLPLSTSTSAFPTFKTRCCLLVVLLHRPITRRLFSPRHLSHLSDLSFL